VYAGQDSVWQGEASVGTLASDESTRRTEHVDVGYVGGAKIERNGGTVTIETVVRWDGGGSDVQGSSGRLPDQCASANQARIQRERGSSPENSPCSPRARAVSLSST